MLGVDLCGVLFVEVFIGECPTTGGFIQIIQQFIINYIIRPRLRKQVAEEFEKNPPKGLKKASRAKDVTPKAQPAIEQKNKKKKNRNAGKQRSL